MKVAICCLSAKYIHASLAPWCLEAGVKALCDKSIEALVFESTINASTEDFINKIAEYKPQSISFTCYIWNVTKTLEVCRQLKEKTSSTIILGGPEVSYRPADILKSHSYVDYVVTGEGEEALPLLLNRLNKGECVSDVHGISYRSGGEIISVPEKEHTETPPSPYSNDFYTKLNGRIAYI
ncbi:MAG: cobalamin-dependent protein, partial [Clostridia bacterium]|nr:cobalamin-dependent protein [Clostridia bacterium]